MSDAVSRETGELVFGDRFALALRYAEMLGSDGVERGLLGPREVTRLWDRHLLNSAALVPLIALHSDVVDVGSGAGLPGVVLAIARPDLTVTLVEPLLRRSTFLQEVGSRLQLDNLTVLRARAEDVDKRMSWHVATARAVAPLDRLATWCLPLVRPGGTLLALKGRGAAQETGAAAGALRRAGAVSWDVETIASPGGTPTTVVRVRKRR